MIRTIFLCNYPCGKQIVNIVYSGTVTDIANGISQNNAGFAVIGWEGQAWLGWNSAPDKQYWIATLCPEWHIVFCASILLSCLWKLPYKKVIIPHTISQIISMWLKSLCLVVMPLDIGVESYHVIFPFSQSWWSIGFFVRLIPSSKTKWFPFLLYLFPYVR